jgi:predicted permease
MRAEHWFYTIPLRLRSIFPRSRIECELDEEFAYHIDMKTEEFLAAGFDPAAARRAAMRAMNGVTQRKEDCRDTRRVNGIENALQDLRYGMRTLTRSPGFTAVALLTLALGIGANTTIFSVIDAVLLRPPGFPDPGRLVQLMLFSPGWAPGKNATGLSIPEFIVLREQRKVFDEMAACDSPRGVNLTEVDPPEQVRGIRVSAGYFALFGANPAQGRTFTAQEDQPGGPGVAVITEGFRNRRFHGADPTGKALTLGGGTYTILGVLDASFPAEGAPDVFLPLQADPSSTNPAHIFRVAARLHPGVTLAMAKAELQLAHQEFKRRFPNWTTAHVPSEVFTAEPLWETTVGESRRPLLVLSAAVGLVLLIACANMANLLMARATVPKREIALRAVLGAGRNRIVCQLLVESTLLSIGGGMAGLLVGRFGLSLLLAMRPDAIPRLDHAVTLNSTVLAFTFALAIVTGVLFGILPAFSAAAQLDGAPALIAGGERSSSHPRHIKSRSLLVVVEMALA